MFAGTHVGLRLNCVLLLSDCNQNLIVIYKLINCPNMKFHENMLEWFWNHCVNTDELTHLETIDILGNFLW